jgi:hypothetical protein
MAKNAIYILGDSKRHAQFSAAALKQAKRFDINRILPQYEQYYRQTWEKATKKVGV